MNQIDTLQSMIDSAKRIVFFGGAGVSKESGIPDFRSPNGLYHQKYRFPPEQMLSRSFFDAYPEEFFRFYREKMLYPNAQPNPAHRKLAELEHAGKLLAVVTQNIDGLHQAAGSKRVLELHGSVHRNYCVRCHKPYGLDAILQNEGVPRCECGGIIKPDVVLYEEPLDEATVNEAVRCIGQSDLLIVAGTSLTVWPAAGLLQYFRGNRLVVINPSQTAAEERAQLVLHRPVGEVMEQIVVRQDGKGA